MRIIDIINKSMEYNELLAKMIKAEIWFLDPKVPQDKKDNFGPKYEKVMQRLAELSGEFDGLGIKYESEKFNEIVECIEIPEALKRKDIEIFLEDWAKHLKKEKLMAGIK
jgi:hypothetical protein